VMIFANGGSKFKGRPSQNIASKVRVRGVNWWQACDCMKLAP
jgi:hypothetical protein